ncbi:hypothetical protein CK203_030919 [Vitis vinifera]|uniref:Uncharacterized protein n=1 Tax=Vitis vinifera TaxID=29760 RepID=A0A438I1N9_VITVI|nr:hypothetical protein CK203_030919 [Vitis vinifera]
MKWKSYLKELFLLIWPAMGSWRENSEVGGKVVSFQGFV